MPKVYKLTKIQKAGTHLLNDQDSRFPINYKEELNTSQYEAVTSVNGSFLLIAGAGTGKTRTLVYRVARLIESGADPKSILLLTFTRKAASEMMTRASMLLDKRCEGINGGTFHSFANLTLRKYSQAAGLDSNFTILDQGDSEDIINLLRSKENIDKIKKRFPNKSTLFKIISLSVNKDISLNNILLSEYPHFFEFEEIIISIAENYKSYKRNHNMLDYDDLLLKLRDFLFSDNPVLKKFLSNINYTMVDEYQDTNKIQAEIIKGLTRFNPNIMVVGDDSQSIYSFRGADFNNILEFPVLFPETKIIKLEHNYRSTSHILNFTNFIIEQASEKYSKHLFSENNYGDLPAIIPTPNENFQSQFIVDKILSLREEGIQLNEIAVLFRSSYFSFDLEIELNKAKIPFVKFGGMKFIETSHIKDVLAFMRIIENPKDLISWFRVLLLHEGIGAKKSQNILDLISSAQLPLNLKTDENISKLLKPSIIQLFEFLDNFKDIKYSPAEIITQVIEFYQPLFRANYDDFNKRKKDIDVLDSISQNYRSLNSFLSDMALDPPRDSVAEILPENKDNEFITLSTIHSAKGLEWHTVFIINLLEGYFPSSMSAGSSSELEEERRLMYVASTRAKKNLYITYPMNIFDRANGYTISKPSRFIDSVNENIAEKWVLDF